MPVDTRELMRQVGRIRVITSRLVDERVSGDYHSVFKGRGIEFDEVREYVPGDDVRAIDWNVTARTGHPFVKRYCEERELTVIFVVDVSGSQSFGSLSRTKADVAAEFTCLLALSALRNQDKVGLILFSDRIETCLRPRRGRTAAMRLVREVLAAEETGRPTDIAAALRFLNRVQKKKAVVFLLSDFQAGPFHAELEATAHKHDVICCPIEDERESVLTPAGLLEVVDPERHAAALLDTGSRAVRRAYALRAAARRQALDTLFLRLRLDRVALSTSRPYVQEIHRLFRLRQRRRRMGGARRAGRR